MEENKWVVNINNELDKLVDTPLESSYWSKQSIYRIPACVTDLNRRAYTPHIVSIGPFHHGVDTLAAMEEHKRRALLHFLRRSGKKLDGFVQALAPEVQHIKDAYGHQLDARWQDDPDGFLQLMIVDGCFILELLRATTRQQTSGDGDGDGHELGYAANDPVFSDHGELYIVPFLKRDMLMLENQIPMLVLEKIMSVLKNNAHEKDMELTKNILDFFSQPRIGVENLRDFGNCLHILDVHRKSLLWEDEGGKNGHHKAKGSRRSNIMNQSIRGDEIIRTATELNEAGICIKASKTRRSLKSITFSNGVLRLPMIVVDDALESLYLNLIAFERFHVGAGNEVTSYIFFMDSLIDSTQDVSLLHSCGVIQNALGSDKAVANLFNSLSRDIALEAESNLDMVHKKVSSYCQQRWHRWRANLCHTYFTNPWAILSFIAAIFLFTLTITQTVYSVLSYVNRGNN